jgi:hypothetical protein
VLGGVFTPREAPSDLASPCRHAMHRPSPLVRECPS